MKYFCYIIITCLLLESVLTTKSQAGFGWEVESVTFVALRVLNPYQISADGSYLVQSPVELSISSTNPLTIQYRSNHYTGLTSRWLNNTVIYREYNREGWGEPPECVDPNLVTFGFYDAQTNSTQVFCLIPPASYIAMRSHPSASDMLERSPFDNYVVFVNNRFLVDLQSGTWQDLQGTLPTSVTRTDTLNWVANGHLWWNPQSQRPMARIDSIAEAAEGVNEINDETILLCPVENANCQPIVSVQNHIHGNLADIVISPDGQTLMWSSRVYPTDTPVRVPGYDHVDIAAFTTNVQTSMTSEIFRLSSYSTIQAQGINAQWSEDGQTLGIEMRATGEFAESSPNNGLILAQFSQIMGTPENGPIVYVSKRTGNWDVYKINPDGSDDTSLTSSYTGQDWSPAWSPDGTHIAFKSLRDHSSGELYTMNADGSNVVRLTSNTFYDVDPDYSPDGSKIVFTSARNGTDDELWTMNPDGTGQTLLYDSAGDDNQPVWSPDGSQIAFASNQSGNWEVWVIPSTGGTATNLTNHASLDNKPAWSADGSQIAWVSDRTGYDVYVMPSTGGTATNLSNHTAYDSYPAYSPDGSLLAFTSNRDGEQEVWTMTVTGATPTQLTFNTALEWDPDWVALTAGNEALLSAPAVVGEAIPDNTPKPEKLNALPAGTSEATQPDLFYVGAWVDETVAGASVRTTHSVGGEMWFSFEGTEVILHVVTRPDALPIEVCIDEVCQTIDLYSAQTSLSSITLGNLTAGAHTVHIINDSAGYFSLDAMEVPEK